MITKPYRLTWDASTLRVASLPEAHREARRRGLGWFEYQRWNWQAQKWEHSSMWAWSDSLGRFVAIPESRTPALPTPQTEP